jgi:hypothetical protein
MDKYKPRFEGKHRGKIIVKSENLYLREQKITDTEINETKECSGSQMQGNTEDHIKEEEANSNVGTSKDHTENKNWGM